MDLSLVTKAFLFLLLLAAKTNKLQHPCGCFQRFFELILIDNSDKFGCTLSEEAL